MTSGYVRASEPTELTQRSSGAGITESTSFTEPSTGDLMRTQCEQIEGYPRPIKDNWRGRNGPINAAWTEGKGIKIHKCVDKSSIELVKLAQDMEGTIKADEYRPVRNHCTWYK